MEMDGEDERRREMALAIEQRHDAGEHRQQRKEHARHDGEHARRNPDGSSRSQRIIGRNHGAIELGEERGAILRRHHRRARLGDPDPHPARPEIDPASLVKPRPAPTPRSRSR